MKSKPWKTTSAVVRERPGTVQSSKAPPDHLLVPPSPPPLPLCLSVSSTLGLDGYQLSLRQAEGFPALWCDSDRHTDILTEAEQQQQQQREHSQRDISQMAWWVFVRSLTDKCDIEKNVVSVWNKGFISLPSVQFHCTALSPLVSSPFESFPVS